MLRKKKIVKEEKFNPEKFNLLHTTKLLLREKD
jgi:hypothetical protein